MSYTNETTYYGLPLPTGSDKSTFTDNNTAFQAVDAALHAAYEQSGAASEDLVAVKADIVDLKAADVTMAGDIDAAEINIEALQQKELLQDAAIDAVKADAFDMITAFNEPTATSAHDYAIGDYFIYNDVLYKALTNINIGDTIVPDTNCTTTNVTSELKSIQSRVLDISVTGDGVKTYAQLLNELFALLDTTKLTYDAVLKYSNYTFHIASGVTTFSGSIRTTNEIRTYVAVVTENASTYEYVSIDHSGVVAYHDMSASVVSNGTVIGISY